MARNKKTVITCAITGAIHTPTMSDALPYTAEDIAGQAAAAAEAGATVLHLHARNPKDGSVSLDPDHFGAFLPRIKQATDAVVNISTGGSLKTTIENRVGGRVSPPVRPHHRAYGSVHGGSKGPLPYRHSLEQAQKSPFCQ